MYDTKGWTLNIPLCILECKLNSSGGKKCNKEAGIEEADAKRIEFNLSLLHEYPTISHINPLIIHEARRLKFGTQQIRYTHPQSLNEILFNI